MARSLLQLQHFFASYSGKLYSLAFLLLMMSMSCFGTMIYLLAMSPDIHSGRIKLLVSSKDRDIFTNSSTAIPHSWDHQGRYLAYLPHSGFHNQRIALENALVLARILDRTLLVPPVRLGDALGYMKFDMLQRALSLSSKDGLWHCAHIPQRISSPPECADFFTFTHVPWHWLIDFGPMESDQKLIHHVGPVHPWIYDGFDGDTLVFKDNDTYSFRIVDHDAVAPPPNSRYASHIHISSLAESDARLIQLGTLFGSSRLHLRNRTHRAVRKLIRENMVLANPVLRATASAASHKFGPPYLGAHIRMGDGPFRTFRGQNTRAIWYRLVMRTLNISLPDARLLEGRFSPVSPPTDPPDLPLDRAPPSSPLALPTADRQLPCRRLPHTAPALQPLNIPLFISTDSPSDSHLELLTHTFPCTFFLNDVLPPSALDGMVNDHDSVPLKPFLVPFVDALVVAGAWTVVGTEGSTFSAYVEDVLWRKFHGMEIVQHG